MQLEFLVIISLGLSSFSSSDFWLTSPLSDCSLQFLGKSHVVPKKTNFKIFTATHFGIGLVAKKMVFLVSRGNLQSHQAELDSFLERRLNGPAVTMLTVQLHYAVILARTTVKDSGKTQGYLGGTEGLEKQSCLQLGVQMINRLVQQEQS